MADATVWQPGGPTVPLADANLSIVMQEFVATAGQSIFILTAFAYTVNTNTLLVFINGVRQRVGSDFIESNANQIQFTSNLELGDNVSIQGFTDVTVIADASLLRSQLADTTTPGRGADLVARAVKKDIGTNFINVIGSVITADGINLGIQGAAGTVISTGTNGSTGASIQANRSDGAGNRYLGLGTDYTDRFRLVNATLTQGPSFSSNNVTEHLNGMSWHGSSDSLLGYVNARTAAAWDLGIGTSSGNHMIFWTYNGSAHIQAGFISSNGTTTTYNTASDERIKDHIVTAVYDPDWIDAIPIYEYEFLQDPGKKHIGTTAQALEIVEPSAVTPSSGTFGLEDFRPAGVDSSMLVWKLILEVQHLRARVRELETLP